VRHTFVRTTLFAATVFTAGIASAQSVLPDTSESTLLTATVSEQARVEVPVGVTFIVDDVAISTAASAASVTVDNIVLTTASKQLVISLQANAASFSPSVAEAATWVAGDVSWNAATFTNATGASGTLSNAGYNAVATCTADAAACSTEALVFTLAANEAVKRAGDHTLAMTWKFESVTP
jgi:hypothetical protein